MNTSLESRNKCNNELKFYYFDLLKLMVQIARNEKVLYGGLCDGDCSNHTYIKIDKINDIPKLSPELFSVFVGEDLGEKISNNNLEKYMDENKITWIGDMHSDGTPVAKNDLLSLFLGYDIEPKDETFFNFDL